MQDQATVKLVFTWNGNGDHGHFPFSAVHVSNSVSKLLTCTSVPIVTFDCPPLHAGCRANSFRVVKLCLY